MLVAGVLAAAAYGGWYSLSPAGGRGTSGVAVGPASAAILTATPGAPETATVPPAAAAPPAIGSEAAELPAPLPAPAAATAETPAVAPIAADGIAADTTAAVIAMAPKAPPPPPAPPDTLFLRDDPVTKAGAFKFYRTAEDLMGKTSQQSVDSKGAAER
jgi:hypothetical protein